MKRRVLHLIAAALIALGPVRGAASLERVLFEKPLLDAKDRALVQLVDGILQGAQAVLADVSSDRLAPAAAGAEKPTYALATVASTSDGALTLVAKLRRLSDGAEADPVLWTARPIDGLPLLLARGILARWRTLEAGAAPVGEPPVLIDEVPTASLDPSRTYLYPWSLALRENGTLVAALGSACLELDAAFRIVGEPGRSLADRNLFNYAGSVSLTMAGTVILRPLSGSDLYRIPLGSSAVQKIPAGVDVTLARAAAMPNGSVLVIDPQKARAYLLRDGAQSPLPLELPPELYWQSSCVAPDGTLWYWDPVIRGFRIFTADGILADFLLPLVDPASSLAPTSFVVTPGGDVVVASLGSVFRFRRDGTLVWKLSSVAGAEVEALPAVLSIAFDESRGLLYLGDTMGQRILKLIDRDAARPFPTAIPFEEKLLALRKGRTAVDPVLLAGRARLYEEAGSVALAKAGWQDVLDAKPGDAEAARRLAALELAELRAAGDGLAARAIETLRTVGVENARPFYQQALAKYELALSRAPGDADTQRAVRTLKELFSDPNALTPPITVLEASIGDLFPCLMLRYREQAAGTVTVKNTGTTALEAVTASAAAIGHDDPPLASAPVARLAPGAAATIELRLALGEWVLENDEDRPLAVRIEVTAAKVTTPAVAIASSTLMRRTALSWDETGRIAAFITPNERVVDGFAAASLADVGVKVGWRVGARLLRAIRICEGIGAHGIAYVEDPEAPFSKVFGSASAIDTVRFARDTLLRKTGDCDDTTVLVASALESQGIATAVLTTPGHIFLAFDTGETAEAASQFAAGGLEVIVRNGTGWIPVETTVLKDGFAAAWKAASALVKAHRNAGLEFLTVRSLREQWAPLPLPASTVAVAGPAAAVVTTRFDAALAGIEKIAYASRLAELERQADGLTGRQLLRIRMLQGILHALFGRTADAEKAFRTAQQQDPAMVSPYVNIANLQLLDGNPDAAIATLREALGKVPDSSRIHLSLLQCYAAKGDAKAAAEYLAELKKSAPALAARAEGLVLQPASSGRGSLGGGSCAAPLWSSDE